MRTFISLAVLIVGLIPLAVTLGNAGKYSRPEFRKKMLSSLIILFADVTAIILFGIFAWICTEFFWFDSLGFRRSFTVALLTRIVLFAAGASAVFIFMKSCLESALPERAMEPHGFRFIPAVSIISAVIMGLGLSSFWNEALLFLFRVNSPVQDPVFRRTADFYLISLPFYFRLLTWITAAVLFTAFAVAGGHFHHFLNLKEGGAGFRIQFRSNHTLSRPLTFISGLFLLCMAVRAYLSIFAMMYSGEGYGAGHVDMVYRYPGYKAAMAVYGLTAATAFAVTFSGGVRRSLFRVTGFLIRRRRELMIPSMLGVILLLLVSILPQIATGLQGTSGQSSRDSTFLENHRYFTGKAYGIGGKRLQVREIETDTAITRDFLDSNRGPVENPPLLDEEAALCALRNIHTSENNRALFHDVDIDRYVVDGHPQHFLIALRELPVDRRQPPDNHPTSIGTVYLGRFGESTAYSQYTQRRKASGGSSGDVLAPRPFVESEESREIRFGELGDGYVLAGPLLRDGRVLRDGHACHVKSCGVSLRSVLRRILYSWRFNDPRLFAAGSREGSVLLFRRNILRRVSACAPFLVLDRDPYPFLDDSGRIRFIIDGYTVSPYFPCSAKFTGLPGHLRGINYIRNSVKAVVDAGDGCVDLYITDREDILIAAYDRMFPGLLKPPEAMPKEVREHLRYPLDLMTVQARMCGTLGIGNTAGFMTHGGWRFAAERYRGRVRPVEPYYALIDHPSEEEPSFSLCVPFSGLTGGGILAFLTGSCGPAGDGKLRLYILQGKKAPDPLQISDRMRSTGIFPSVGRRPEIDRENRSVETGLSAVPLFRKNRLVFLYMKASLLLKDDGRFVPDRVALADHGKMVAGGTYAESLGLLTERQEGEVDVRGTLPP